MMAPQPEVRRYVIPLDVHKVSSAFQYLGDRRTTDVASLCGLDAGGTGEEPGEPALHHGHRHDALWRDHLAGARGALLWTQTRWEQAWTQAQQPEQRAEIMNEQTLIILKIHQMLFCSLWVPPDQLQQVFREELHVHLRSGPEPFHTWQGWFYHTNSSSSYTQHWFCTMFVLPVDLQVKCEVQGDLGLAGARVLPLRAPLYPNPGWSWWRWW